MVNSHSFRELTKTFSRSILIFSVNFAPVRTGQSRPDAGRYDMKSIKRPACTSSNASFLLLRAPQPETADRGNLRLGSGCISAGFPALRAPQPETADRGNLRLGSGCISA